MIHLTKLSTKPPVWADSELANIGCTTHSSFAMHIFMRDLHVVPRLHFVGEVGDFSFHQFSQVGRCVVPEILGRVVTAILFEFGDLFHVLMITSSQFPGILNARIKLFGRKNFRSSRVTRVIRVTGMSRMSRGN